MVELPKQKKIWIPKDLGATATPCGWNRAKVPETLGATAVIPVVLLIHP